LTEKRKKNLFDHPRKKVISLLRKRMAKSLLKMRTVRSPPRKSKAKLRITNPNQE